MYVLRANDVALIEYKNAEKVSTHLVRVLSVRDTYAFPILLKSRRRPTVRSRYLITGEEYNGLIKSFYDARIVGVKKLGWVGVWALRMVGINV